MDEYYAWMEDDKQEVRTVLAEDAVSSMSDDLAKRADEELNPKTRKKLKKKGAKQSVFERLHKTGLRGYLTSSKELSEEDAAVLVSLQLNKETQTREVRENKKPAAEDQKSQNPPKATCTGISSHMDGDTPTDPVGVRKRATGPMACTEPDKHASVSPSAILLQLACVELSLSPWRFPLTHIGYVSAGPVLLCQSTATMGAPNGGRCPPD